VETVPLVRPVTVETPAQPELPELLTALEAVAAAAELAPNAAAEADPDLLDLPVNLADPEIQELLEALASPENLLSQCANLRLLHHASHAQEVNPDHQDLPDPTDSPEAPEAQDNLAETHNLDLPDHLDLLDPTETPDSPDHLDSPDNPERALKPDLDLLDHLESPDQLDNPDSPEDLDNLEALANPDPKDLPEDPDSPETTDSPVNPDPLDSPEALARRVSARNTAPSTAESSSRTELADAKRKMLPRSPPHLPSTSASVPSSTKSAVFWLDTNPEKNLLLRAFDYSTTRACSKIVNLFYECNICLYHLLSVLVVVDLSLCSHVDSFSGFCFLPKNSVYHFVCFLLSLPFFSPNILP
jgi:hypothetical protein